MSARLRRVEKLVELGADALQAARAAQASAAAAVTAAREVAAQRERLWSDAAQRFGLGVSRSPDLDAQAAHLRTLRLSADDAARKVERAVTEERERAAAVVRAATEHRKLEMLRDRILEAQREEDNRLERRASDELAARAARSKA